MIFKGSLGGSEARQLVDGVLVARGIQIDVLLPYLLHIITEIEFILRTWSEVLFVR